MGRRKDDKEFRKIVEDNRLDDIMRDNNGEQGEPEIRELIENRDKYTLIIVSLLIICGTVLIVVGLQAITGRIW